MRTASPIAVRRAVALTLGVLGTVSAVAPPVRASAPEARGAVREVGASAARAALAHVGRPYVFGGESPRGFDCSGLVQYVYRQHGVSLPRTAAEQFACGQPVDPSALLPGDLVFQANTYKPGISHVGIYIGDGRMVHAQNSQTGVVVGGVPRDAAGFRRVVPGGTIASVAPARPVPAPSVSAAAPLPMVLEGVVEDAQPENGVARMRVEGVVTARGERLTLEAPRAKVLVFAAGQAGASLLTPGRPVRVSGTDAGPGTPLKVRDVAASAPVPEPEAAPVAAPRPAAPRPAPGFDFERGWDGWTTSGVAFGRGPEDGLYGSGRFGGWTGNFYLSSAHPAYPGAAIDSGRGRATSPEFTIEGDRIRFRIAGGRHDGETCLNLVVDGEVVRTATGDGTDALKATVWDVAELRGRRARLEVVDERSVGLRGYVLVDRIELDARD